jgi:hypothetical protein
LRRVLMPQHRFGNVYQVSVDFKITTGVRIDV